MGILGDEGSKAPGPMSGNLWVISLEINWGLESVCVTLCHFTMYIYTYIYICIYVKSPVDPFDCLGFYLTAINSCTWCGPYVWLKGHLTRNAFGGKTPAIGNRAVSGTGKGHLSIERTLWKLHQVHYQNRPF